MSDQKPYLSQAARGEVSPRRYVGRSRAAGVFAGSGRRDAHGELAPSQPVASAKAAPWSVRLAVAVFLIVLLLCALRVWGFTTPPVDPVAGSEAMHASFANVLSEQVDGSLDPVRYFPPPAPWHGQIPALPWAGLPIFGWLTAAMQNVGAGEWAGRAVSLLLAVLTGLLLFGLVRRTSGARAGLYSLLFFSISPLSILMGQQYSPAMLLLASQALAMLSLCAWRLGHGHGLSGLAFALTLGTGALSALLDPGNVFLLIPAAYVMLWSFGKSAPRTRRFLSPANAPDGEASKWWAGLSALPNRGKFFAYATVLLGSALLWRLMMAGADSSVALGIGDGGGGLSATLFSLLDSRAYVQIVGGAMEKVLTILGALLMFGGLLRGARRPLTLVFHFWLLSGALRVLLDASRMERHDDVLLPLLLPVCALVGLGCAWAGSLPARVWLAVAEYRRESDSDYSVSPNTSWLLDLPEELANPATPPVRPQAQVAFGRSVAQRAQVAGRAAKRAWAMGVGNFVMLGALAVILVSGWETTYARLQTTAEAIELSETGRQVRDATQPGSRIIIAGPFAPGLFYTSERTGWALSEDVFGIARVEELHRNGASYLLSVDQDWLGRHPDYVGLLTSYSVHKLGRGYILFDLTTRPAASNRLYFLESGHTLGGEFRRFWEQSGGVARLGYPISEELEEVNPVDNQTRKVQYFERAVLEYHPEFAGRPDEVMLASIGRWVTRGRSFPTVEPFKETKERVYFPQTGHAVKESFLRYWQREGGVATFGYPISEEMPEISSSDGKVYTVQYFERARLEWHPVDANTPNEVQLGLLGKQALDDGR